MRPALNNITKDTHLLLLNPRFLGPCMAGVFCLVVATVVGVSYLFTMATALLALPIASYCVGAIILRGCRVNRPAVVTAVQGERAAISFTVTTLGYPPHGMLVRERLPRHIEAEMTGGVPVPPDGEVSVWLRPRKRGRHRIGPAEILAPDPLGMFQLTRRLQGHSEILVYPKPIPIRLAKLSGGIRDLGSVASSGRYAASGDFAGVRDYKQGDELRHVHWKTVARTQRMAVKEFEEASVESVTIALDASMGSDFGRGSITSLDAAAGVAAYAIKEFRRMGRPVRLVLPKASTVSVTDIRGQGQLNSALAALAEIRAESSITPDDLLRHSSKRGQGVLLIVTQVNDRLVSAVREVRSRGTQVKVVIIDPQLFGTKTRAESSTSPNPSLIRRGEAPSPQPSPAGGEGASSPATKGRAPITSSLTKGRAPITSPLTKGGQRGVEAAVQELEQAGAEVEIVREVGIS